MHRSFIAAAALLVACQTEALPDEALAVSAQDLGADSVTRTHVAGDVYHYRFTLPVGSGPNGRIAVHRVVRERAPWIPRPTTGEVMLNHGDFSGFDTNFPLLSTWLAEHDIDVWGLDRRWTQAPADADLSDFDAMDLDQMLDDLGVALAFARGVRLVTGSGGGKLTLAGFSRGGELAYFYASREATRPPGLRHIDGLVPIDVYVSLAPEDEDLRQFFCDTAAGEYDALDLGFVDVPNDFQILTGQLALSAPDEESPIFPGMTNRDWMLLLVGQTYAIGFVASPFYHLNGVYLDENEVPTGLRFSTEQAVGEWLAAAPPHQSMRESADTDQLTCGDAPLPLDVPLSRIRVPLFLLGAKGGYGHHAEHSTTQVSSTDVTTLIVSRLPDDQEDEDFGHADLLFAADAPALAWEPLRAWLTTH